MLERLLDLLQSGGTRSVDDLARVLDTSPDMVKAMLESLRRMGYLKAIDNTCNTQCGGCSLAYSCGANAGGKVWALTNTCRPRTAATTGDGNRHLQSARAIGGRRR